MTTAPTRGPYRTGIRRRAQIITAAARVFGLYGYAGSSMKLIADEVGVTPAALLRHFGGKGHLLIAVMDAWELEIGSLRPPAPAPGIDRLLFFSKVMRYHMVHPDMIKLFLTLCAEVTNLDHPARGWVETRYARIIRAGVDDLRAAGQSGEVTPMSDSRMEIEVRALFAVMDGLELQWIAHPDLDLGTMFDLIFAELLQRWGYTGTFPRP